MTRELSLRAAVLGGALSALLAAANAYLGLYAGMTVSAAIPASVLSMAALRAVRGTILENNLVQTSASAGECVAAGAIFTLPALLLLGATREFSYFETSALLLVGGILGVLFTIPLRKVFITTGALPFPEGVATARVLEVGHASGAAPGIGSLVAGAVFGALAKGLESGLLLTKTAVEGALLISGRAFYLGVAASPALIAVGYITGFEVSVLMLAGGLLNWTLAIPLASAGKTGPTAIAVAFSTWSTETRYLGVGAMTAGGLLALYGLRRELLASVRALFGALSQRDQQSEGDAGDLPSSVLLGLFGFSLLLLVYVLEKLVDSWVLAGVLSVFVVVTGFLFCAVAGYMAGLVGSSNNPVSGVTLATLLLTSGGLLALQSLGWISFSGSFSGPSAAILVGVSVCTAAAIGGDNMQDLKAGALLGASPKKQQFVQLIGVLTAALSLAPVLNLLASAYGFGLATPEHPQPLRAPQASLMASVANGVFGGALPLRFVLPGALLSVFLFFFDQKQKKTGGFRTPPLAVAIGLYLPLELSSAVFLGGVLSHFAKSETKPGAGEIGVLLGAGIITGEALAGLGLAAAIAAGASFRGIQFEPSFVATTALIAVSVFLFRRRGLGRS